MCAELNATAQRHAKRYSEAVRLVSVRVIDSNLDGFMWTVKAEFEARALLSGENAASRTDRNLFRMVIVRLRYTRRLA
jgi:hypothetical protein